jgi:hypothetical protein
MKRTKQPRIRLLKVWLTPDEYTLLLHRFSGTTFRILSYYIRAVLFEEPIVVRYRDQSLDEFLAMAISLKQEQEALTRNLGWIIDDLKSRPPGQDLTETLTFLLAEEFSIRQTIKEIQTLLIKIYDHVRKDHHRRGNA